MHTLSVCAGWFKYITMIIMLKYADMQNTVSDCECVTVSAFLARDSDITERIKGN